MFFELDVTQGEWFPFFGSHFDPITGEVIYEEPAKDARVKVRPLMPFFESRLATRKREVDNVYNPKSRGMERQTYFKDLTLTEIQAEREDGWDYCIMDFECFKDPKTGKVIECTRENKIAMMKREVFDRFIAECLRRLSTSGVTEEKELAKNSSTGLRIATSNPDPA
jgi:hypothetical protein